jgi:hypothetical protein
VARIIHERNGGLTSSEIAKSAVRIGHEANRRHRPDAEFGVGLVVDGHFRGMLSVGPFMGAMEEHAQIQT